MQPDSNLKIDGDRLWSSLMEMARIGATPKGGVKRLTLTDLDHESRELFKSWCAAAGCTLQVDKMGSMFVRREGADPALPPVMIGSHLDTQPTGGRYDGVLGVLAGLEILRAGFGINRLGLSPVAFRGSSVEHDPPFELVGSDHAGEIRRRRVVGQRGGHGADADVFAASDPSLIATIEHLDRLVADGPQHPPHPGGDTSGHVVVDHHVCFGVDSQRTQRLGEVSGLGQRMTPVLAGGSGEVGIEVYEDGPGDVAVLIGGSSLVGVGEVPADVAEHDLVPDLLQFLDRDQWVHGAISAGAAG